LRGNAPLSHVDFDFNVRRYNGEERHWRLVARRICEQRSEAVQVDSVKATLKAPGTERLKL
jgi:hypothetical protein